MQNNEYVDHHTGRFFMRTELEGLFNDAALLADLDEVLPAWTMQELNHAGRRRIVVLVTKEAHCLGDLLMKSAYGGLDVDIAAVIGNPATMRRYGGWWNASIFPSTWSATTVSAAKSMMRVLTPAFFHHFPNLCAAEEKSGKRIGARVSALQRRFI